MDSIVEDESVEEDEVEEFKEALLALATLDLEDDQVRYPKIEGREQTYLFGGTRYDLYILDRPSFPESGPFEMVIDDGDIIGFIRGTTHNKIVSFNLIHVQEEKRGSGIGTDIYEQFLQQGYAIKSDTEITDSTERIYLNLLEKGYRPLVWGDGRVGLEK